ncbi:DNA polymerase III subunit delta' [Paenibacillus thermoaerophilus]|uniref:DNA polymerase III subunit delta n=1 Tax=Paenibacillus thermoaerophilus TaxID=1215385 RepID=A0ABW2V9G5_9BACL|nr:DNA polymerase III subunit delta' [Paenibacillus thermoaerophilus]TMV09480.1 DNA polymerase III subunit delta' [Paenibacillus thermoaerophilus]
MAGTFASIPGQERAKRLLQNGLRNRTLAHAYVFAGPPGTGKLETALTLAQALFCERGGDEPCGQCRECRRMEHGNHPDLYRIGPDGASIKIDQIRELQKQFAYRASEAPAKVYVIESADRMTVQAANSLLKFLEEPQTPALAVLITDNANALLPTIRSRAQLVPFLPIPPAVLAKALEAEGVPASLAATASRLTAGLEAARELARAEWFAETRSVVLQLGKECLRRLPASIVAVQQKAVKSAAAEHWDTLFDLFGLWFQDLARVSQGASEQLAYPDQREWYAREAYSRDALGWLRCADLAGQARRRLRQHVQPQLVLEQLLIHTAQGG